MYSSKIEYLAWDSNFFEKKIGRIYVEDLKNTETLLEEAQNAEYQLIYVFTPKDSFFTDQYLLKQFNGHLADRKVSFEKEIELSKKKSPLVSEYQDRELTTELEQLVYESGKYSRFKLDKNFRQNDFYRMYKTWIEKSVKHEIADKVFVAKVNDKIQGMATLKINADRGHIGLIAVSPETQGKGYGKALVDTCEEILVSKGVMKLEVPTQLDNIQACNFYEKCGFTIKEIINIYHFWL